MLRKLLGIAPKAETDASFSPSPVARLLATKQRTDYDGPPPAQIPESPTEGTVLVVCTEQSRMTMANGTVFSTGNHPVETLVPMLHLQTAGYALEIATPTGAPVALERWAMPNDDAVVMSYLDRCRARLDEPRALDEVVAELDARDDVRAVFIPGGHGAMLGLPENEALGRLLRWTRDHDAFVLSLCHGPAALLATDRASVSSDFFYAGYEMVAFPDGLDRKTPLFGYMPGQLKWFIGQALSDRGAKILNDRASGATHRDRELVTGDSPDAANAFGKLALAALRGQS